MLVGSPATGDISAVAYSVTVTAEDPWGASTSDTFDHLVEDNPDAIFVDGFESGSAAGWSSSVP